MEEIKVTGGQLVDTVKGLIKEGNVRKVIVKNRDGKEVFEVPLTLGVVGIAVAPLLVAVGAVAGIMNECTVCVERDPKAPAPDPEA